MSDFINTLIANWTGVIRGFALLAAITLIIVVAIVSKLAWGRIIITTIVAAFVIWAVTGNGLGWFSEKIGEETNASAHAIEPETITIYEASPHDPYVLVS